MKTFILYDSFFGNTEQIALAIGNALGDQVTVSRVGQVKPEQLNGIDLLVVGSPTRAARPSPAISDFLKNLPAQALKGMKVAAFDTRIGVEDTSSFILRLFIKLAGYAAKPIANALTQKGGTLALPPEGFLVKDSEGPLKEGELERAASWAKQLRAG